MFSFRGSAAFKLMVKHLHCTAKLKQRGNNTLALLLQAINNLFLTHYLLACTKMGSSTVSGLPQRLLGAGEGSVRGRCIHSGTLPGCLFDQAAGGLGASNQAAHRLWEKHIRIIRRHYSEEGEDLLAVRALFGSNHYSFKHPFV